MRIIYVTANLPFGTDEAFIVPEICELERAGHEVLIVPRSPAGPLLHGRDLIGHSTIEPLLSPPVLRVALKTVASRPRQTRKAIQQLWASRSTQMLAKNLAILPKAMWLANLATTWRADHIHAHWAATTSTMAMIASSLSGIPWSFTAHRWDIVENNLLPEKANHAAFARFISDDGLRMARSAGMNGASNARVLRMGVNLPQPARRLALLTPAILCPARLTEVKGHRFLLEAWSLLAKEGHHGELWLAGNGELRHSLETLVTSLGLNSSVRFLGALPHEELLAIYESGRVAAVVLASIDMGNELHEGIPVALMEAMSFAIPVVATTTGGVRELVQPDTGLLVPPNDSVALAGALRRFLTDAGLRETLGQAGRQQVAQQYEIGRIAAELSKAMVESKPAFSRKAGSGNGAEPKTMQYA